MSPGGRTSSGWLKIGLAVRIAQDLQLMQEPEVSSTIVEQEEARRSFWSIYLLDKLISCGKGRPLAISDEDCNVQLPGSDESFEDVPKRRETLRDLLHWSTGPEIQPSNFGLSIVASSIFGRCSRYVFYRREGGDETPPWDSRSQYASLESALLLVDRYLAAGTLSTADIIRRYQTPDGSLVHQEIGHVIFAHVVFHLTHCLLNHPFLVRLRLRGLKCKAPPGYISQVRQKCTEHAQKLANFMDGATTAGCQVTASFYAYAACVAGSILSLMKYHNLKGDTVANPQLHEGLQKAVDILERLGSIWETASKMVNAVNNRFLIYRLF